MKKALIFLVVFLVISTYLFAQEEKSKSSEIEKLKDELKQLQIQFNKMKRFYNKKIKQLQTKIEELEKEKKEEVVEQPTPLPGMGKPALELPDISVIGNVVGTYSDDETDANRNKIVLEELEVSFQGYLYPEIRSDVFIALHRHEEEEKYEAELEEGYISFLKTPIPNLSFKAGKKLLDFGKLNSRHPHHWNFVDRPEVLKSYFGGHGLVGQGADFSYLVPLPFFLQLDLGAWYVDSEDVHSGDILGLAQETYSTRLWSSFSLAENQELEFGLSALKGYGAHYSHHKDKVKIGGVDLTYRFIGQKLQRLLFQSEFLFLDRDVPAGDLDRWGFYSHLNYRFDKYWDVGFRYDWMETPFPDKEKKSSISGILTHSLTETTKLRLQYRHDLKDSNHTLYLQVTFGIGPHAHPLE